MTLDDADICTLNELSERIYKPHSRKACILNNSTYWKIMFCTCI